MKITKFMAIVIAIVSIVWLMPATALAHGHVRVGIGIGIWDGPCYYPYYPYQPRVVYVAPPPVVVAPPMVVAPASVVVRSEAQPIAVVREDAITSYVNVVNSNGSFTPVRIRRLGNVWVGPKGEQYLSYPTAEQLKPVYGF
jgi:hypothetical protein